MMSVLRNRVDITRQTQLLFAVQVAASSIPVTRTPSNSSVVQVKLNQASTGVLTVNGTKNLSGITDTISFSSSSLGITVKDFDTVTSIACDATLVSSGSTIEVKYFGKGGGSASSEYAVVSGWPCFINRPLGNSISTQDYRVDSFGSFQTEKPLIFMAYDESFTPAVSDFIVDADTNEKYFVLGVQYIQYSVGYENYWRIIMEMR